MLHVNLLSNIVSYFRGLIFITCTEYAENAQESTLDFNMWLLCPTPPYGPDAMWHLDDVRSEFNQVLCWKWKRAIAPRRADQARSHMRSVGLGCRVHYCQLNLEICFNQTKGWEASIPAALAAAAEGQPPCHPAAAHVALCSKVLPNYCWQSRPPGPQGQGTHYLPYVLKQMNY